MAKLVTTSGLGVGDEYPLELDEVVIGRSLDCDLVLTEDAVSRKHAKITRRGTNFIIEDVGSTNGTFVNGVKTEGAVLKDLDKIEVGKRSFTFHVTQEPGEKEAASTAVSIRRDVVDTTSILNSIDARQYDIMREAKTLSASEQLKKISKRLKIVNNINEAIAGSLDLSSILTMILDDLFSVYPQAERGFVMLLEEGSGNLVPQAIKHRGVPDDERITVSSTIISHAVDNQKAVLSADASSDQQFASRASIADFDIHSVMCVPLIYRGQVLGIIYIDTTDPDARFSDENLSLLTAIGLQAAVSIATAQMHAKVLRQSRLEQDVKFAKRVQLAFLPQAPPSVPQYEFASHYTAAYEIGGDFYNFIQLNDRLFGVCVADVSGKGVPAALMMARLTSDVKSISMRESSPGKIVAALNKLMCGEMADQGFVTFVFVTIDVTSHRITITNAGHPPPLVKKGASGKIAKFEESISFPLGVVEDAEFEEDILILDTGDSVTLYTDGVIEAMDKEGNFYTQERLEAILAKGPVTPKGIVKNILADLGEFFQDKPQNDDLTLVCFARSA